MLGMRFMRFLIPLMVLLTATSRAISDENNTMTGKILSWYDEETDDEEDHEHHGWAYEDYDEDLVGQNDFDILQREGNVTIKSEACVESCEGEWGAWQPWTECNIPIPGNSLPKCHHTLRIKKRFCAHDVVCHEVTWEFCAHKKSCYGEWTPWTKFEGNCTNNCGEGRRRNRTCLSSTGKPTPGVCLGSRSDSVQREHQACDPQECNTSYTLETALIASGGVVLLILLFATICGIVRMKRKKKPGPALSHVSSSSFLVTHWRIISQRFTRRTRSEPHGLAQEVAIGNNYSAVHVYESADDYAQVCDNVEERHYESLTPQSSFHGYEVPIANMFPNQPSNRCLHNEYAAVDNVSPYARMKSVVLPSTRAKEMKRARSLDEALTAERNIHRHRPIPGMPMKPPLHRGVSQLPLNKTRPVARQPSMKFSSARAGAASRIKKKMSQRQKTKCYRPNLASCSKMPHFSSMNIEEDRYGYLVPNGPDGGKQTFKQGREFWQRQNTQSFSSVHQKSTVKIIKSISLPSDINFDTYVTMKQPKEQDPAGCSKYLA